MEILTDHIHPNEPCFGLVERFENVERPSGAHDRRLIQKVWVVRGDCLARYERDLGPAENFRGVMEGVWWSDGGDSVQRLQELADAARGDTYWRKVKAEIQEGSTFIKDVVDQREERYEWARNKSVFGPHVTRQRNMTPTEHVWREWFDERARRTGRRVIKPGGGVQ